MAIYLESPKVLFCKLGKQHPRSPESNPNRHILTQNDKKIKVTNCSKKQNKTRQNKAGEIQGLKWIDQMKKQQCNLAQHILKCII